MTPSEYLSAALLIIGGLFFLTGTLGLLRFPDVYTRLHALTKADNAGLGLIVTVLALQAASWTITIKLLLIWLLVLLAWRALACPDLFKAIVLYVDFGLFMALAWVPLAAPDVALAEAAIDVGLTGATISAGDGKRCNDGSDKRF